MPYFLHTIIAQLGTNSLRESSSWDLLLPNLDRSACASGLCIKLISVKLDTGFSTPD